MIDWLRSLFTDASFFTVCSVRSQFVHSLFSFPPIVSSHRQGGDGSYGGDDSRRFLANEDLQALQLQRIGNHATQWLLASTSQSQNRVPTNLLRNGLHGNAHQQLHRKLLLELRRTIPSKGRRDDLKMT